MGSGSKAVIHCCVEKSVYDILMRHCEATGQTKTMAIKRAIREYCKPGGTGDISSKHVSGAAQDADGAVNKHE